MMLTIIIHIKLRGECNLPFLDGDIQIVDERIHSLERCTLQTFYYYYKPTRLN